MRVKIFEVVADSALGGAPKHVLILSKGLDKKKFEPVIVCPSGWLEKQCKDSKLEVKNINFRGLLDSRSIKKLRRLIKNENPDVVHLHGIRAGWLGTLACLGLDKKVVYTEHLYTLNYHLKSKAREIAQIFGLFFINLFATMVIAPSSAVKKFLVNKIWVRPAKIKVIVNGLDDFKVKKVSSEETKIGFIGSLNHQKGVQELIKAMYELSLDFPELELEIVGDGPLRKNLEKQSEPFKKQIKFVGPKEDIKSFLETWSLIVVPSISESFGQVAVEAGIASLPVVATAVGGLPEVIIDDGNGILVKPADNNDLVNSISYLLHNPKEAERMGKNGRKIYEKFFTSDKMVAKIEKAYSDLIGKKE